MRAPPHCNKKGAAINFVSVHGYRHRVDDCDDSVRIVAVRVRGLKQLRWLQDVHVRRLLPDKHEYRHRLFLRSVAGLHPLERPDEPKVEAERASLAGAGGIVSCIHFWLGPSPVPILRLSYSGSPQS